MFNVCLMLNKLMLYALPRDIWQNNLNELTIEACVYRLYIYRIALNSIYSKVTHYNNTNTPKYNTQDLTVNTNANMKEIFTATNTMLATM